MTLSSNDPAGQSMAFSQAAAIDTRIELASWSFSQKDFDATSEHANHVLDEIPGDPRALVLISACEILLGNLDAGISGLNQAIVGAAIDRYKLAAEEAYECMMFGEDQSVEIAWEEFNECIQFLSQPKFASEEDNAAWRIALERAKATSALVRNDVESAIDNLKAHLRAFPTDVEGRFELGRAYFHDTQFSLAAELFRQVLDVKPDHSLALSMLARVAAVDEDFSAAIELAARSLDFNPENCKVRLDLAEYHFAHQNYRECLSVLADAKECVCSWFGVLSCRLECYRELRQYTAVMDVCQDIMACEQSDVGDDYDLVLGQKIAKAHLVLGVAKTDGLDKARLLLEQEAEEFAADLEFGIDVASLFRASGEQELARRAVECLSYVYPYEYDVQFALSITEREVGNVGHEIQILKQLAAETPERIEAWLNLAEANFQRGRYKEALFFAWRALDYGGSEGQSSYKLAATYARIAAPEMAMAHLKNAIELNNSYCGMSRADENFVSLHQTKAFKELTQVGSMN